MKKALLTKLMLLLCALIAGSSSVWATDQTFSITISSFSSLPAAGQAAYDNYSWSAGGVSGVAQIYADANSTSMQMNGGNVKGKVIYNTTAIPGYIKKVNIVKASGSNRGYSVYGRFTAYSGSGDYGTLIATANIADGNGRDYTVSTGDYDYFVCVCNPSSAAYLASVNVTYELATKHTLSSAVSPASSGTVTLGRTIVGEGKTTTIVANANDGYHFVNWTYTGTGASIANSTEASTTFTMGTENATVTANFEANPAFTVSFSDGGSVTETSPSAGVTLPSRPNPDGYTFRGWSETNVPSEVSVSPTIIPAGAYNPTNDITLYPVYSRTIDLLAPMTPATVSIADYATTNSWVLGSSSGPCYGEVVINSDITATCNTDGNNGKYYGDWRMYQSNSGTVTISAGAGCDLTSVTFTYTVSGNGILKDGDNIVSSGVAYRITGTSKAFTATATSGTSGQVRISAIKVCYKKNPATFYTCNPVTTVTLTITSAGWATFCSDREIEIPSGITAYYAQKKDANTITLKPITGNYIPEKTGVVVSGTQKDYPATLTAIGATLDEDNLLNPWLVAGTPTETTYYTLAVDGTNPIFKKSSGGTLAAGKAYLVMPADSPAPLLNIDFYNETTNINNVSCKVADIKGKIYNLNGQRVAQPIKGLYIVNGKKVIVK